MLLDLFDPIKSKRAQGDLGEKKAKQFLKKQGLKPIALNYLCKHGEIDLVMLDTSALVFVEVKMRSSQDFGGAVAAVTYAKQQKIKKTAQHFLLNHPKYRKMTCRFDVVAIQGDNGRFQINWIKQAFE